MLEAVLHGALARGTNTPTLVLLNTSLIGCIFILASLLVPGLGLPSWLLPHILVLLVLAVGLLVSINWLIAQTGTVSAEEQRRELFGGQEGQQRQEEEEEEQQGQQAVEGPGAGEPGDKDKDH